jgi:hypothetical protein
LVDAPNYYDEIEIGGVELRIKTPTWRRRAFYAVLIAVNRRQGTVADIFCV